MDYRARTAAPDVAAALSAWTTAPQVLVGQSLGGLVAVFVDLDAGVSPTFEVDLRAALVAQDVVGTRSLIGTGPGP